MGLVLKLLEWSSRSVRVVKAVNCYLILCNRVVTICTAQWSLYVPYSGHYMYRTVVNICTAKWSIYVPHNGHYMYRTVVTICTAQWSLYVPHSGHYMYHQIYRSQIPPSVHTVYLRVLCGSENKQRLFDILLTVHLSTCAPDGHL